MKRCTRSREHVPSDSELDAMDKFIRLVRAGKRPSTASFLSRYPEFADTLRPVLEGMTALHTEYRRFQKQLPGADVAAVFGVPGPRASGRSR
ncbi:MAG TPA: hypothetical protein VMH22_08510 [bacterium]|nr:hypothetical protein [bacterium]